MKHADQQNLPLIHSTYVLCAQKAKHSYNKLSAGDLCLLMNTVPYITGEFLIRSTVNTYQIQSV
jgi:hypothetical protein